MSSVSGKQACRRCHTQYPPAEFYNQKYEELEDQILFPNKNCRSCNNSGARRRSLNDDDESEESDTDSDWESDDDSQIMRMIRKVVYLSSDDSGSDSDDDSSESEEIIPIRKRKLVDLTPASSDEDSDDDSDDSSDDDSDDFDDSETISSEADESDVDPETIWHVGHTFETEIGDRWIQAKVIEERDHPSHPYLVRYNTGEHFWACLPNCRNGDEWEFDERGWIAVRR